MASLITTILKTVATLMVIFYVACSRDASSERSVESAEDQPTADSASFTNTVSQFRKIASTSFNQASKTVDNGERAFAFILEHEAHQKQPYVLPIFFCGAVPIFGNLGGEHPIVAFYNPVIDSAILTKWQSREGTATMVAATAVTGSSFLRGKPSQFLDRPRVVDHFDGNSDVLPVAIVKFFNDFRERFHEIYPPDGAGSKSLDRIGEKAALENLLVFTNHTISRFAEARTPGEKLYMQPQLELFRHALKQESGEALAKIVPEGSILSADQILRIGFDVHSKFRETIIFGGADGGDRIVLYFDPANPINYLTVLYSGTPLTVESVAFASLLAEY